MSVPHENPTTPVIVGRSSSHFTRVTRIFAAELRVDYDFEIVRDLMSHDAEDYGGNPALKLPTLRISREVWFGALNICRELSRRSSRRAKIAWPEDLASALLANAQELTVQAMATEVGLILSRAPNGGGNEAHREKMLLSLRNTLSWLDREVATVLGALPPERDLSFLEVTLYSLVTHLEFREVLPTANYSALSEFTRRFASRTSARETVYRFDT